MFQHWMGGNLARGQLELFTPVSDKYRTSCLTNACVSGLWIVYELVLNCNIDVFCKFSVWYYVEELIYNTDY